MGKTGRRCPKCKGLMDTKRKDAKQCRICKRKQQDAYSHQIKRIKRNKEKEGKIFTEVRKRGIDGKIGQETISEMEFCLRNETRPTIFEYEFLKGELIYDWELKDLPEDVRDEEAHELFIKKFKPVFDRNREFFS